MSSASGASKRSFVWIIPFLLVTIGVAMFFLRSYLYMGVISIAVVFFGIVWLFLYILKKKANRKVYRFFIVFTLVAAILFVISLSVVEAIVVFYGERSREATPDDCVNFEHILLLGAGINGDRPSLLYRERLDRALELLNYYDKMDVIICGGKGTDEIMTEAEVGKKYLMENGIDPARIITETESRDTSENIAFAREKVENLDRVVLISNDFHIYRASLLARDNGIESVLYGADTPWLSLKLNYYLREYVCLVVYLIEKTGITFDTSNWRL